MTVCPALRDGEATLEEGCEDTGMSSPDIGVGAGAEVEGEVGDLELVG